MNVASVIAVAFIMFVGHPDDGEAKRYSKYRWDDTEVILVENRMGPEWNEAVEFSVNGWERTFPRLDFKVIHKPKAKGCNANDRIVICEAKRNKNWSGLAWPKWDKHEMYAAVIWVVNYEPYPGNEGWRGSEVVSVWDVNTICHELGHGLGLDHNNSQHSCLGPGVRQGPGKYDRQSLKMLYKERGKGWP